MVIYLCLLGTTIIDLKKALKTQARNNMNAHPTVNRVAQMQLERQERQNLTNNTRIKNSTEANNTGRYYSTNFNS